MVFGFKICLFSKTDAKLLPFYDMTKYFRLKVINF